MHLVLLRFDQSGVMADPKYQLVFSFYQHPVFGMMVEPYLVHLLDNGQRSLSYQRVSFSNIRDFLPHTSDHEQRLLTLIHKLSNEVLAREFRIAPAQLEAHLQKLLEGRDSRLKGLLEHVQNRLSKVKSDFFALLDGSELLFEAQKDGYPAGVQLTCRPGERIRLEYGFQDGGLRIRPVFSDPGLNSVSIRMMDEKTPVVLAGSVFISLPQGLKPSRIKTLGEKKVLEIQPGFRQEYIRKILIPDLAAGFARLTGQVRVESVSLTCADLYFSFEFDGTQLGIFGTQPHTFSLPRLLRADLDFYYGDLPASSFARSGVWRYREEEIPVFQQIIRFPEREEAIRMRLEDDLGLEFSNGNATLDFRTLRTRIIDRIPGLGPDVRVRFSPGFNQLSLRKPRLNLKVLEKIDYFEIEGSIDWDGQELSLEKIRSDFHLENGWLRTGDRFIPLEEDDQLFLQQVLALSFEDKKLAIRRNTALAVASGDPAVFAGAWEKLTSLLARNPPEEDVNPDDLSPNFGLRPYQKDGIRWLLRLSASRMGGILADDMGLGKTFQTAAFLHHLHFGAVPGGCSLVVMPSTLLFNWEQELKRFSDRFRVYLHSGPNRSQNLKMVFSSYRVVLVSFQTLARDLALFQNHDFRCLIVDEAHNLKNPGTVSYKAVARIRAGQVFLLTGTPVQNSPSDLWALSELCNPGLLSQKIKPQSLSRMDQTQRFLENLQWLQALVRPFLLRRTKDSVLSELPDREISTLVCPMTEAQEKIYLANTLEIQAEMAGRDRESSQVRSIVVLKALTRLRLLANHPNLVGDYSAETSGKLELVKEKLGEVLDSGNKVLIFSSFVKHLEIVAQYLDQEGIRFSLLTGQTRDRQNQVEGFKSEAGPPVFLISLKAGGVGLNLVEASYVFLLDPWWNPAAESQAMDRVYRIGQKQKVIVYKFITSNTVEEKIVRLQERKQLIADQIFSGQEGEGQPALSLDLLRSLLETREVTAEAPAETS